MDKLVNLTGIRFDVTLYNPDGSIIKLSGAKRDDVIFIVDRLLSTGEATKITARDRQTGKQTVFTKNHETN